MTKEEFLNDMTEILDQENTVSMDAGLTDIEEWDSLGYLMFQSKMLERGSRKINSSEVKQAKTIANLYELVRES